MAAPTCALLRPKHLAWAFATLTCWLAFLVACCLMQQVLHVGVITYELGNWAAPWGIEYRVDALNAFVLLVVTGIGALVTTFARASVEREVPADKIHLFYGALLLCLTGLLGIAVTGDAFNVFVFLEISSLSSYALIGMGKDRRALTAAFRYLVMGTIGGTFFLIGIGLMYMMTGTLNMADLAHRLPDVAHTRTIYAAFAFLAVGIGLKLAVFPLHLWLPNAYTYAPTVVTAFLAATATKVALYVLLRFFFTIFGAEYTFGTMHFQYVVIPMSLAAVVVASAVAIYQGNAKRLLAYSSIAQIGYMTLGMGFVSITGLTAGVLHLFNHALIKGCLFLALGCVYYRIGSVRIEDMKGLSKQMPWTMGAFVAGGLSLVGVPFTVGFVSKWYLVLAALEAGWWPVAGVVLLTSLMAMVYIGRIVEAAYFKEASDPNRVVSEAPLSLLLPTWVMVATNVYFGVNASFTTQVAEASATLLLGGSP